MKKTRLFISILIAAIFSGLLIYASFFKKYDIEAEKISEPKLMKLSEGDSVEKNKEGKLIKKGSGDGKICWT